LEDSGESVINLVKDRLFWQAWNKSAFLFSQHLKPYQIHKRFMQNISQDVAWLGFPSNALEIIKKIAESKGFVWEQKSGDHIVIKNVTPTTGYEEWWAGIVKKKPKPIEPKFTFSKSEKGRLLASYKTAYDLCLHVHRATSKMPKEFRYDLGVKVKEVSMGIMENLHLMANGIASLDEQGVVAEIYRLRIDLRIMKDLFQISLKQYGFLIAQTDTLAKLLRADSADINTRIG